MTTMDVDEVALEAQIDALRQQQTALESHLGLPVGQTHHSFHDTAVDMIRQEQARGAEIGGDQTATDATEAVMTREMAEEDCATCCPRGCCPHCCLCTTCCGATATATANAPCECGCTDCVRGNGTCRRRGYTRYYYNTESQRGVTELASATDAARAAKRAHGSSHALRTRSAAARSSSAAHTSRPRFSEMFAQTDEADQRVDVDEADLTLHARLTQIEQMRRKYSQMANRAVRDYQRTVSDHKGYEEERQRRLRTARPFSFEDRELTRPMRIREVRLEQERRERERAELSATHQRFKARAVPPTTFMNKYDVMVEEWCQRKLAVEMLAREQADRAKEEEAYVRLSAQGLRHAREEMMGVRYDKHGKQITRSEAMRRAESADAARRRREATRPNEVPLEVQLKLWPALKEHEQVRKERILHQAKQARDETDTFFRQAMPLLANPAGTRLFSGAEALIAGGGGATTTTTMTTTGQATYGIGQAIGATTNISTALAPPPPPPPMGAPVPLPPGGAVPLSASLPPGSSAPIPAAPQSLSPAVPLSAPPTAPAGALPPPPPPPPSAVPLPLPPGISTTGNPAVPTTTTTATGAAPCAAPVPGTLAATEAVPPATTTTTTTAASKTAPVDPLEVQRRYNRNLTFQPHLKPGVPNFERLWAEDRVALLERKKRRPPTTPKPFQLTPSEKENKVVGKRHVASRSLSRTRTHSAAGQRTTQKRTVTTTTTTESTSNTTGMATTTTTTTATTTGTASGVAAATTTAGAPHDGLPASAPPKGTRAHALRTQAVYRQYVDRARDNTEQRLLHAELSASTAIGTTEKPDPAVDAYWRGVAERRKEVRQRLTTYLPVDPKVEHEEAIRQKVSTLRAAMRENEASAKAKLDEMRTRVAQMPPLFAEPTHLNDLSKARAEAERDILQMLKDTGLEAHTIRDVLVRKPQEDAGAAAGAAPTAEAAKDDAKDGDKTDGEDKYSTGDFSSTDSTSTDSSDTDDTDTDTDAGKKKSGYGDDEFESSSSDGSV